MVRKWDFGSAGHLRGHKATLFEGGVRSSLVVWAPGFMEDSVEGTRNKSSIFSALDLVPTLLSIAGVEAEADFDGENLQDTLLGVSQASRSEPLFFRRPPDREEFRHYIELPDLAVRDGQWKLYCDYDGASPELYDLEKDPSETKNVVSEHSEIAGRLTHAVLRWNASMPKDRGEALGQKLREARKRKANSN